MDSRQLAHFCAVVREGSFTKAAEMRHVSQSALSQQVKALEFELGVALLVRHGRMMVAGNRGWLPVESRVEEGRTGTVIRRIPLHDGGGHSKSEYYAFWPKTRTNSLVEEFAGILEGLFGAR